jgi:hypothetical protein
MAANLITLADSIVASLQGAGLTPAFTAERKFLPRWDRSELATLRVTVIPLGGSEQIASRRAFREELLVDVGLQKAFDPTVANTDCDPLVELFENIKGHLRFQTFGGYSWAATENVSNNPFWADKPFAELAVFTAATRFTWRKFR